MVRSILWAAALLALGAPASAQTVDWRAAGGDLFGAGADHPDVGQRQPLGDLALERIGGEHPALWRAVSELVYGQLDASVHGLAQMLALPPRARIAARLMAFADSGVAPLTQADLAELCGLSRKAVSAHLAALERSGTIARAYGKVQLLDVAALARLVR